MNKRLITELDDAWLGISVNEDMLVKPLDVCKNADPNIFIKRLTWLMCQPEYFSFACKYILNIDLLPFQCVILAEMWKRKFPMFIASRGAGKSFLLAVYGMLRGLLLPNRKIVVIGAAFRQSKVIWEYCETIWNNSPVLRSLCGGSLRGPRKEMDMYRVHLNGSTITALPVGDGQKIRGQRAQDIFSDEFATLPINIFENVIAGFASVTATPADNVRRLAKQKKAKKKGIILPSRLEDDNDLSVGNQIVISGTAYYDFNHFADYWKKWKQIINSKGDIKLLEQVFNGDIPKNFHWKDYSVIRLPYDLIPEGFMDEGQIARSKATIHSGIFSMEFLAVFTTDSQGFFKRSLIESCVPKNNEPVELESGEVSFQASLSGNPTSKYVFGIDPASENDNFSIIVLELCADHRRIVHCWTTTRKSFHERRKKDPNISDTDFYGFCARKIRELKKKFPTDCIAIDSQGGGVAIVEALHDSDKLQDNEVPFWPTIDPNKAKDTDGESGLHIIEICNFADAKWLGEANHGMRKDFEDKVLIFPMFDPVTIGLSIEDDNINKRFFDTFEDCIMEIEELKNELSIIEISQTASGRDKWDTPETKLGVGKKGRLRKDRYSALLMANMSARIISRTTERPEYNSYGGFSNTITGASNINTNFIGPSWFTENMDNVY